MDGVFPGLRADKWEEPLVSLFGLHILLCLKI